MKEQRKTPKLRFPGFTDDWEQRKLGDISESYSGGTPTAGKKEYYDGDIPFIRSGEISGDKTELFITDEGLNNSSAKMVKIGDILYALYGATSGEVSISKLKGAINQAILAIHPHEDYDSQFLMQWLRKSKENIIGTYLQGGQGNLSGNIVKQLLIDVPTYEEQKKIGAYFEHLDNLITLHQRKCDAIKELKKGMLQKMFPKNGEKIPEVRFPGFTDDWEQRKFSELYARSSEKNDGSIGIDKNITVATMQFRNDVKVSTTEYLKTYYTFKLGDIAFEGHQSKEFRYGRFVENDIGNGIVSHIFAVFRPIQEYDLYFWKYAINNETLMQRILARSTKASTMMHDLVTNDFLNEIFLVPSVTEQKQIGDYFRNLDRLITLHQRKVEKLKEMKKGLLQQMFV